MVNLIIDGKNVKADKNMMVLEAAGWMRVSVR